MTWALSVLNGDKPLPDYLSDGRLTTLYKNGRPYAEVSNTRPIVILPHTLKIIEKVILGKIKQCGSNLFKVGPYQTSFQTGTSTQKNLSLVTHTSLTPPLTLPKETSSHSSTL